jgi:hypothetical protein
LAERGQRIAQLAVIWMIPVIGALVVFAVHRRPEAPSGKYRESLDPGDDFGSSGKRRSSLEADAND